ncbi:heparinase II/III domain-containing protein [Rubrivirga sp.]|uniref:heparinase II/III domain-containing protein n=1 Tax=Rubrivirga sp. TaxID=1885344 RepID=UPI003B52ADEB
MTRRDLIRLGGSAAALALLPLPAFAGGRPRSAARLFFDLEDVPRIRATAASPILSPTLDAWAVAGPAPARRAIETLARTGEKIRDLNAVLERVTEQGVLHLVDPDPRREALLLDGIDVVLDLPDWDFFVDGTTPIGIQRASAATERLLFLREVLGDALGAEREARLMADVADKGCAPCALTLSGMEDPASVQGWRLDDQHAAYVDYDMANWPVILGANNLRAAPLSGLGLGALALDGLDARAGGWLDQAVRNARVVLGFFDPDGTYFEGVSYADYTLRSLFAFFDAHQRVDPSVRWADRVNLTGTVRFILAMQAGRTADGSPDVVNFSDARNSAALCVPAWVARQTEGTPTANVAQFAVERVSRPGAFQDVLWVDPDRPLAFPPESYRDVRLDNDWIVCRTGWAADDAVLALRSGGPANHEHADRNGLLFKAYGERLLTDPHGAAYDARLPGWLLRQTEAHNAVLIDGRGHQYHGGEEGVNESLAAATVTRFEDDGDRVWFTSDATPAYRLVDPDVALVRRTVAFLKPDVVVVLDEVRKSRTPSRVEVRFHPDNRDGAAVLEADPTAAALDPDGAAFAIARPTAALFGRAAGRSALSLATGRLDLPDDLGHFPFVRVAAEPGLRHEIVTVLVARPAGVAGPAPARLTPRPDGWTLTADGQRLEVAHVRGAPEVRWT